jgi:SAM-dependent methyltransferase
MGLWTEHVVPRIVDHTCATKDVMERREQVCQGLHGRVLEIGFGSGLNLGSVPKAVEAVVAVEPSDVGWRLSADRRAASGVHVERSGLDGQAIDEDDDSCDAALTTFTLCTIPDAVQALREVRRVVRPGGQLHFLEHGLSPDPGVARWQRRLEPLQRRVGGGCHLTRDVPALLSKAGYEVVDLEMGYLPGPTPSRPFSYLYAGVAVAR